MKEETTERAYFSIAKPLILLLFISITITSFLTSATPAKTNPTTELELGEKLFFDNLLSKDYTISCASCHRPEFAFADTTRFSIGVRNQLGVRNTPTSMNMTSRSSFFYDGRAATIEEQVLMPIHNPIEMDLSILELLERLNASDYKDWFNTIYNRNPDSASLSSALSAFVFSLESLGDTPFDRFMRGEPQAMSEAQIRGRELFNEKAKCFDCHFGPDFTGDEFKNIGLFNGSDSLKDVGRFEVTQDSSDLGKMKVPLLRNIAITAPYMHNGMFQTLEEVIEYYDNPNKFVHGSINRDTLLREPLSLTAQEKDDLLQFLHALTDDNFSKSK